MGESENQNQTLSAAKLQRYLRAMIKALDNCDDFVLPASDYYWDLGDDRYNVSCRFTL